MVMSQSLNMLLMYLEQYTVSRKLMCYYNQASSHMKSLKMNQVMEANKEN